MIQGVLLAAGAGRRMGRPKALLLDEAGEPWLLHAVEALRGGGCEEVVVVLGAAADEAIRLLDGAGVDVVVAPDWAEGMGASLRAGLRALDPRADVAVVSLVDLPDVGADVVARVVAHGAGPGSLARATYAGVSGHPVLLGRDHWPGVADAATGDRGARDYLAARDVTPVECGDLATGEDRDTA